MSNEIAAVERAPVVSEVADARSKIFRLQEQMLLMEQAPIETSHTFCNGIYARKIVIPAGATLVGKIHKTEHMNIVAKGRIAVFTADGGQKEVAAGEIVIGQPGTKRVGYALEDTVWVTLHATAETDLERLEQTLIEDEHLLLGQQEKPHGLDCDSGNR
jgi:hypothetical protein